MARVVGKIYAQALFELACQNGDETIVYEQMLELKQIFVDNGDFLNLLSIPTITRDEKTKMIDDVFSGKVTGMISNFLKLLCEKGRISNFMEIQSEYEDYYDEKYNIVAVKARTYIPMSEILLERLQAKLKEVMGKDVKVYNVVDKTIMGGIILEYSNFTVTSTVRDKLEELKNSLIAAHV